MITIVDFGIGNLRSLSKAFDHLGAANELTGDPDRVERAERLVLPGDAHFGDAMRELEARGLVQAIRRFAAAGRPLLGICVGMQLVMEASAEAPGAAGLGLIAGDVHRFPPGLKTPQMGWNTVRQVRPAPLFRGIPDETYFYFIHSYYVRPAPAAGPITAGVTEYGVEFPSVFWRGNFFATQFHPEKSQQWGLRLLQNFAEL